MNALTRDDITKNHWECCICKKAVNQLTLYSYEEDETICSLACWYEFKGRRND